eukprot:CAMPEP_0201475746 /NCGR_PEP_ID=MMETSP0151_2-20130828/1113_1 /ASSEMBLY_ACC=CAM_ASM_000257 /TAXON_ID=200890 /ORGANISM="Paramoeba atlantica, Strain 621/1 / CCAP 1560/9" /LENGTH=229 /DNA_ID=CAMNT_0047855919 /DNA_START=78 /DNA_END=767 /DNA_ORIENTATION=-
MISLRVSCGLFLFALLSPSLFAVDPLPPVWNDFDCGWDWLDSDHRTILSRHQFHFGFSGNVRTVNGHFYESGDSDNDKPMGGFANFTLQSTIRYYPPFGLYGTPQPCESSPWDRDIRYDAFFNNLGIPDNYTYVGQKVVKGILCNGWHFLADNVPEPQGNTMWTTVPQYDPNQPPVWMDIIWNNHAINYTDWFSPPQQPIPEVWTGNALTLCSTVDGIPTEMYFDKVNQ